MSYKLRFSRELNYIIMKFFTDINTVFIPINMTLAPIFIVGFSIIFLYIHLSFEERSDISFQAEEIG